MLLFTDNSKLAFQSTAIEGETYSEGKRLMYHLTLCQQSLHRTMHEYNTHMLETHSP